jgi:pyrroline-5-carboxylate reductase
VRIGFLGAGRMAEALARGFLAAKLAAPSDLFAHDVVPDRLQFWRDAGLGATPGDNRSVCRSSELIFIAVKPQAVGSLLKEVAADVTDRQLVVSIAAGVTIAKIEQQLGGPKRIVRVMPNTPCLVGAAASGIAAGAGATGEDLATVVRLFESVGVARVVAEPLLDAVTGLSGSGPAFVFAMIEAMSDGGVRAGLPRDTATALAAQTMLGAAKMVLETGEHPGALKDAVASPAGTTIEGLSVLERGGVRGAIIDAVFAAARRSKELGTS